MKLDGRVALVTGSGRRVGQAIALAVLGIGLVIFLIASVAYGRGRRREPKGV